LWGFVFEWDLDKAAANLQKHGVSFAEAATVFGDPLSLTVRDPIHSDTEARFIDLGISYRGRLLVVCYVEREDNIRIITARRASASEQRKYEEKSSSR
jgi:uncharacterized protein